MSTLRTGRDTGCQVVLRKRGLLAGLAAALLGMSAGAPVVVADFGSTRTISLYHIHTKETLTVTYKKDGKYLPEALKKINWLLRDWRENEATEMDPKTIDLLWEMHTELGSREPINIICGYRSEKTNGMLRRTVGGQAKKSYHIRGMAIDAAFPDIPIKQMRYSGLIRERGGVGYYPTSGIPFVHVDTGPVRAWPRLPRYELALLFPNGHTEHKPESGGPLTPEDVRVARKRHEELATQVAAFFDLRNKPKAPLQVAEADAPPVKVPRAPDRRPRRDPRRVAGDACKQPRGAHAQKRPATRARGNALPAAHRGRARPPQHARDARFADDAAHCRPAPAGGRSQRARPSHQRVGRGASSSPSRTRGGT